MMFQVSRELSSIFNFPRQRRSLSRWLAVLRSAPAIALFLSSVCFSSNLISANYTWTATDGNLASVGYGSSPSVACANLASNAANRGFNVRFHYDSYWTDNSRYCHNEYIKQPGRTYPENWNPYFASVSRRSGDSCAESTTYNPTKGECANDEQKGPPPQSCRVDSSSVDNAYFAGNSINFAIGNKFQLEADYQVGNNSSLNFTRSYNSLDGIWRHSFSTYLRFAGTQYVSLVTAHGHESFYSLSGSSITATSADIGALSKIPTGWQYVSTANERFVFDAAGKLTQWFNAKGAVHQLTYSGSQVTVTDNLGKSLTFTEDADHQPLTLTAPGVQIIYDYDANKRLTSVTRTAGGQTTQRQFHYEDSRNTSWLTGITDERGVRYATWAYDDQGRATSSEHADGADRVSVAYNSDGTVSVTNELGKVAKYSFQYIKGVKRITSIQGEPSANCSNSNSTFTYDERGLLKTKTDNKGHLTTYDYNERGLEVSRTEASGTLQARTITTEWHPSLFLPLVVTEFDRITRYQYDNQGRQLSRTIEDR